MVAASTELTGACCVLAPSTLPLPIALSGSACTAPCWSGDSLRLKTPTLPCRRRGEVGTQQVTSRVWGSSRAPGCTTQRAAVPVQPRALEVLASRILGSGSGGQTNRSRWEGLQRRTWRECECRPPSAGRGWQRQRQSRRRQAPPAPPLPLRTQNS